MCVWRCGLIREDAVQQLYQQHTDSNIGEYAVCIWYVHRTFKLLVAINKTGVCFVNCKSSSHLSYIDVVTVWLYQTERRPLTTLATFSSYLHNEKLSSYENSLSSLCAAADYCVAATTVPEPYTFVPCVTCPVDDDSRVFSSSPSRAALQPYSGEAELRDLPTVRSQISDTVRSTVPVGSWLGAADSTCSYNAVNYRTVCDSEYQQAVGQTAFTTPVPTERTPSAYQRSSYQSADWAAGYHSVSAGHSTCSTADAEDAKVHGSCSQLSATISSDQLQDSDQSSDAWSPGVTAKKIKPAYQTRTEHGRRTTHVAASRRASTGSLLCTTVPDLVSTLICQFTAPS